MTPSASNVSADRPARRRWVVLAFLVLAGALALVGAGLARRGRLVPPPEPPVIDPEGTDPAVVRAIDQADGHATARLADGTEITAQVIVGADGSSGVTARHVGAQFYQVDLGLELEIAVPDKVAEQWSGRVLLDWGKIPASYGWVFPKGDRLTVGVIAARGQGEATKAYLREFVDRLGLAGFEAVQDSGHLTRCRSDSSPLRKGQVIVAGTVGSPSSANSAALTDTTDSNTAMPPDALTQYQGFNAAMEVLAS